MIEASRSEDVNADWRDQDLVHALGVAIDRALNGEPGAGERPTGFILFVFPFDDEEGRADYISNADRGDVLRLLRDQIAHFEPRVN